MYLLNLANRKDSNINFETREYPDGQQDLFIDKDSLSPGWSEATITSRFNSFCDLELMICATTALRNLGIKSISLQVPYILGARSDRQFSIGGCSVIELYLKQPSKEISIIPYTDRHLEEAKVRLEEVEVAISAIKELRKSKANANT